MGGKIMNADIQSVSELTAKGATAAQLPNDDKVYLTANSLNKTLKQAIIDGNLSGSGNLTISTKTANYTLTTTDGLILGNVSGGAFTLTLPTAVGNTGKVFTIKYAGSTNENKLTVNTTSSQTIDGLLSVIMSSPGDVMIVVSDGSNWVEQGSHRRVGCRYHSSTTSAVVGDTTLIQPTKSFDSHNAYNTSNGQYTIQEDGLYFINSSWQVNAATFSTTQDMTLLVYIGGSPIGGGNLAYMVGNGSSNFYTVQGSDSFWFFTGQVITIILRSTVAGTATTNSYFNIHKVSP